MFHQNGRTILLQPATCTDRPQTDRHGDIQRERGEERERGRETQERQGEKERERERLSKRVRGRREINTKVSENSARSTWHLC